MHSHTGKEENVEIVKKEHAETAEDLEIGNRMFVTTPREAFITLKDHKEDFNVNPKSPTHKPNQARSW